jgi:hypothetical protein
MMKLVFGLASLFLMAESMPSFAERPETSLVKCCTAGACLKGTHKYFSIDQKNNYCGETCISPL